MIQALKFKKNAQVSILKFRIRSKLTEALYPAYLLRKTSHVVGRLVERPKLSLLVRNHTTPQPPELQTMLVHDKGAFTFHLRKYERTLQVIQIEPLGTVNNETTVITQDTIR